MTTATTGFAELAAGCDLLGIRLAEWIHPDTENFASAQAYLAAAGRELFGVLTGFGTADAAKTALRAASSLSWAPAFADHIALLISAIDAVVGDIPFESF